jgi:hypothetical protein
MDTSSLTGVPQGPPFQQRQFNSNQFNRYNFNTHGPPKFQSRELFNLNSNNYYYYEPEDYSYEQYEDYHNPPKDPEYYPEEEAILDSQDIPNIEIQDEDFCQEASAIPTDT